VSNSNATDNSTSVNVDYYLSIYGSVAAANSFFSLVRAFLFAYGGICAARKIHGQLLAAILRGKVPGYLFRLRVVFRYYGIMSPDRMSPGGLL
jgi:hypothetical protein